jgi:putative chitinase
MTVFPFRFKTIAKATDYATKGPRAIASLVYANRIGNGAEKSGDGWTYRGRGFIQLTGRKNYAEFGAALGVSLEQIPSLAADPIHAARIAGRFWQTRGCNDMADVLNQVGITRAINGGLTGLKERVATWNRFRALLGLLVEAIA